MEIAMPARLAPLLAALLQFSEGLKQNPEIMVVKLAN
jgi:hypothetical protein